MVPSAQNAPFRQLVEHAADVIYRLTLAPGPAVEYINEAVTRAIGYTPAEFYADPALAARILHPDDRGFVKEIVSRDNDMRHPLALRVFARDGSLRWTEHHLVPILDQVGRVIALDGIARDITDRREAERSSMRRSSANAALADFATQALDADTTMHRLMAAALDLVVRELGLPCGQAAESGRSALTPIAYVGEPRIGADAIAAYALSMSETVFSIDLASETRFNSRALRKRGLQSGMAVPVVVEGMPAAVISVFDTVPRSFEHEQVVFLESCSHLLGSILGHRRTEEALRRSEREFRTLVEHSPDIIRRYDRALRHRYVSPSVQEKTGLPQDQFIGRTNRELGQPENLVQLWEEAANKVFATGSAVDLEYSYPGPHGVAHFDSRYIPERDEHGDVEFVLVVGRDITRRRHAEEQLQQTVNQLRRSDQHRREVLTRLVTAQEVERLRISEDIHDDSIQIMVAVAMRLEALSRQISDPDDVALAARLRETVAHAINRLRTLMFELRPPELDREGLAAALRGYVGATDARAGAPCDVVDNIVREPAPDVRAVLYRIAQEAVTNARKHAEATRITVLLDSVDEGVRLRVQDDGRGIDVPALEHLGPHHVGLGTMRERAEVLGGRFTLITEVAKGTVVEAWLPEELGQP